ncbi:hypothetical protein [Agarivorans sp. QJM3NY_25]|uniref:hypothetical protein n=1 Tax=Agarivorans sp. QJM3NY_25 TaxID=3421430 RepID=UPI003D7EDD2A
MRLFISILMTIIIPVNAAACVANSSAYPKDLSKLVDSAENIYMVELKQAKSSTEVNSYTFQVLKSLKGSVPAELILDVDSSLKGYLNEYQSHNSIDFWVESERGSTKVDMDCDIRPNFKLGYHYLLILKDDKTIKSYEPITTEKDRWLAYVKNRLALKDEPIYSDQDMLNNITSVDKYSCHQEREKLNRKKQLYVDTLWGDRTAEVWPSNLGKVCSSGSEYYVQVTFNAGQYITHLPYSRVGLLDFKLISNGLKLTKGNLLELPHLTR